MNRTAIAWTDRTWNPIRGCSRVSEGCRNCYAERIAARFSTRRLDPAKPEPPPAPFAGFANVTPEGPRWTGRVELVSDRVDAPLRLREPSRIFVSSMSDLFHEALPDTDRDVVFAAMALARRHTFQVLTKRPKSAARYFARGPATVHGWMCLLNHRSPDPTPPPTWPLPNVHLGVSVEDQATADARVPLLLELPARRRFVSFEPALERVDFGYRGAGALLVDGAWHRMAPQEHAREEVDWIIVGGESGPGARPFDVAWARVVVAQCKAAGVPCFVKQLGSRPTGRWRTTEGPTVRVEAGCFSSRAADDVKEWPEDLRVQEFPPS